MSSKIKIKGSTSTEPQNDGDENEGNETPEQKAAREEEEAKAAEAEAAKQRQEADDAAKAAAAAKKPAASKKPEEGATLVPPKPRPGGKLTNIGEHRLRDPYEKIEIMPGESVRVGSVSNWFQCQIDAGLIRYEP